MPNMDHYSSGPSAQLTCETCKRRKTKCDKLRPCTHCVQAGVDCVAVERARLPRGRSAKKQKRLQGEPSSRPKTSDLYNRVAMLESVIQSMFTSRSESLPLVGDSQDSALPMADANPFIGRESLNPPKEQADNEVGQSLDLSHSNNCPAAIVNVEACPLDPTPSVLTPRLLQIYTAQVNPIFPILQCTSLWSLATPGGSYLSYTANHPAPRALACAISYMTITTLSNEQCVREFNTPRNMLLNTHRGLTDLALDQADYINTDDLAVLQAFVLFLISIQAHGQGQTAWRMLSLAVRIAQSLALDKPNPPFGVSALEIQMRRRLWHLISLLDVQASFDRGSAPMLHADCLQSHVFSPSDFFDFSISPEDQASSLADPIFITVMAEAQRVFRFLDVTGSRGTAVVGDPVDLRLQVAAAFQQKSQEILNDAQPIEIPLYEFLKKIVNVTSAFLKLAAIRPMQGVASSPDIISQATPLPLAVQFLQAVHELYHDPWTEPFRWYTRLFVPWHAFSVAMDQVCVCSDASVRGYYQSMISTLYSSLQELLGDSHRSLLQQPLARFALLSASCVNQAANDFLQNPNLLQLC
ncbi:hypothetical protein BJX99DRAFT_66650 [Aspergillus californicus]